MIAGAASGNSAGKNMFFELSLAKSYPNFKIRTALKSACLVPKLMKLSRYHITYMARGITAKKLRYVFNF